MLVLINSTKFNFKFYESEINAQNNPNVMEDTHSKLSIRFFKSLKYKNKFAYMHITKVRIVHMY